MDGATQELIRALLAITTVPLVTAITSYLKRQSWSSESKKLLAFGVSCVFATAITFIDGRTGLETNSSLALLIFYAARTFYDRYFAATDADQWLTDQGDDHAKLP